MASTIILSDNGASSGSAGLKTTGGNDGVLILQTTTSGGTATNAVTIDNYQNVGIGNNTYALKNMSGAAGPQIQFGSGTLGSQGAAQTLLGSNYYINSSGTNSYITAGKTARYMMSAGSHYWSAAGTGSADAAITFATVMSQGGVGYSVALEGASSVAGTGITFPASQSASSDANTLDDYEEGGWTPTINFGGSSTGVTYSSAEGTYTKIGRMVTVNGIISLSNHGSATGNAYIGGLPFTVGNLLTPTGIEANGVFGNFANLGVSVASLVLDAIEGTTTGAIYYVAAGGGTAVTAATQTLVANTFDCRFSMTYFT